MKSVASPRLRWGELRSPGFAVLRTAPPGVTHGVTSPRLLVVGPSSPQVPLRCTRGYSWFHLSEVAGGRGFPHPRFRCAAPGVTHGVTSPRLLVAGPPSPQIPLRCTWGYSWCRLAEAAGGRGFPHPRFRIPRFRAPWFRCAAPGVTHGAASEAGDRVVAHFCSLPPLEFLRLPLGLVIILFCLSANIVRQIKVISLVRVAAIFQ
jgi:hypothetical protein